MKQRQCRVIGGATLSSLFLLGLLTPVLPAAEIVGGNTERNPKGKTRNQARPSPDGKGYPCFYDG
jgi:hypothetical protein